MFVCPKGEGVPRGAVTLTATPVSRFASVSLRFGRCGCRLNMALNNWSYSRLRKLCLGPREGDRAWPSSEQLSLLG